MNCQFKNSNTIVTKDFGNKNCQRTEQPTNYQSKIWVKVTSQ